jgi:hypothetical protein
MPNYIAIINLEVLSVIKPYKVGAVRFHGLMDSRFDPILKTMASS